MRVLVTGADGFIGRHVERALRKAGHDVTGTVFHRAPGPGQLHVDLGRADALGGLPDVDVVFNAAGSVAHGGVSRAAMYAINAGAPRALARWARARGVGHFIHTSSVAVYGFRLNGEQRDELRTPRMRGPLGIAYMKSKAQGERHVEAAGVPYTILRPPAVLGEGDTVVSPGMVRALRAGGLPLPRRGSPARRVSLAVVDSYAALAARLVEVGPLGAAYNCADAHLAWEALGALYARALQLSLRFRPSSWLDVLRHVDDPGFLYLWTTCRFGAHYPSDRLWTRLAWRPPDVLAEAVGRAARAAMSALRAGT